MKKDKIVLLLIIFVLTAGLAYTNTVNNQTTQTNSHLDNRIPIIENVFHETKCLQKNAPTKLDIKSAYGDNEAYHPKVLYFENGWNGYKYWMAYSPYPRADDSKENPHIAASHDLINWEAPAGITNPLDDVDKIHKRGKVYNSDPHLVYNSDKDELECWWRFVNDIKDQVIIYRRTSSDGINWTEKEIILKRERTKEDYLSPSIIYEDGRYRLWFVSKNYMFSYTESSDLKNWAKPKEINLNYNNSKLQTWHIDVIHNNGTYEVVLNSFLKGEKRDKMNLYYSSSKNNIDWTSPILVLTPSFASANWDNKGLYRASLLYANDEYYLFYSGISWTEERGIGMINGKEIDELCYQNH